jgi:molybdopterin converting factor subunit 1
MTITILYFAGVRDAVGLPSEELQLSEESISISRLGAHLLERHPTLTLDGVRFAINEEFADSESLVRSSDLVALIPPVSGG